MSAWFLTTFNKPRVLEAIAEAPLGARVTLKGPRRTNDQNALMWVLLSAFADQVVHCGRKYDAADWKEIFMHALGKELAFAPSLDGDSIVAFGRRTSLLSKEEMSDLIELIMSEGAKRGVNFNGEEAA